MEIIAVAFLVWACLNSWVTFCVARDDLSSPNQRMAQFLFVWLLPILGALLVLYLHRKELERGIYGNPSEVGDDFGMSGRAVRELKDALAANTSSASEGGTNE